MPKPISRAASDALTRYLCIELEAEHYALPILSVHQLQAYAAPTPVPRLPRHVRGVTNLHGEIVPVVDLRLRLGIAERAYGPLTVIVFVGVAGQIVGLIVDAASRVLDLDRAQIKPPPAMADLDLSFVAGIARHGDRVIVVLDIEALLRGDPALAASEAARQAAAAPKEGP